MRKLIVASILLTAFTGGLSYGILYGEDPPKILDLIKYSDAIVILRIDDNIAGIGAPDFYSTHLCYIYQTLKGNIPEGQRIILRLSDSPHAFATVYAGGSTHLIFLIKKLSEREPTEYRSLMTDGAQILVSPLGQERAPEGATLEDQIRNVIKGAIAYQTEKHEKKMEFLNAMLSQ